MSDDEISEPASNHYYNDVKKYADNEGSECIAICAKMEEELSGLEKDEKKAFLDDLGIEQSGLDQIIRAAYHLLGLRTFFTVGEPECRAWTFHESANPILSQLISSQLDADRFDYLIRDAYFTGTKYGEFDMERILRTMRVENGRVVVKESGVYAVENYIMGYSAVCHSIQGNPEADCL